MIIGQMEACQLVGLDTVRPTGCNTSLVIHLSL